jgi:hypothetical protein
MGSVAKMKALTVIASVVLLAIVFGIVRRIPLPAHAQGKDAERLPPGSRIDK